MLSLLAAAALPAAAAALVVDADAPELAYHGRADLSDPKLPRFDWGGAYVQASFSGSESLGVRLVEDAGSQGNLWNVFVDGDLAAVLQTEPGTDQTYAAASGLDADADHFVYVSKRTEAMIGISAFGGLSLDDGAALGARPADAKRRISVYGDSLSAGYGDEGEAPCSFTPQTENSFVSHANLIAMALEADYEVLAWSGKGLVRNYGEPTNTSADPLPLYAPMTLASDFSAGAWNASLFEPDAVVISLGTNDFSTEPIPDPEPWQAAYRGFIGDIAAQYSAAPQFFLSCFLSAPADACANVKQVAADTGAVFIDNSEVVTTWGCDGHPDTQGQQAMADNMVPVIKEGMGW